MVDKTGSPTSQDRRDDIVSRGKQKGRAAKDPQAPIQSSERVIEVETRWRQGRVRTLAWDELWRRIPSEIIGGGALGVIGQEQLALRGHRVNSEDAIKAYKAVVR